MFMQMARAAATRATCYRLNVGAVLASRHDHNVVAVGYNGAPSGQPHCTGGGCRYFTSNGCKVVHAEINALRRGVVDSALAHTVGSLALYVTHSPCQSCAEAIIFHRSIGEVYFEIPYRDPAPIQHLLRSVGRPTPVRVWQLLPSGLAVDQSTGQLVELT